MSGAIDETQIQSLASERRGARCSARGFLKAEQWQAPLNVADLAVANLFQSLPGQLLL